MQSSAHSEYLAWGWDVLLKLKLHESEAGRKDNDECDNVLLQDNEG